MDAEIETHGASAVAAAALGPDGGVARVPSRSGRAHSFGSGAARALSWPAMAVDSLGAAEAAEARALVAGNRKLPSPLRSRTGSSSADERRGSVSVC